MCLVYLIERNLLQTTDGKKLWLVPQEHKGDMSNAAIKACISCSGSVEWTLMVIGFINGHISTTAMFDML